ncbi:MAG: hypothetical protein ACLRQF_02080 [Thomasclavelia ramosa]
MAPGNLLVKNGKLAAVIDFGVLGVGILLVIMQWLDFLKKKADSDS